MRLLFIAKGSIQEGMGHIMRSAALAITAMARGHAVQYCAITDESARAVLARFSSLDSQVITTEQELAVENAVDIVIFDMLRLSDESIAQLKPRCHKMVSISPIFDQMPQMDAFFHRSTNTPTGTKIDQATEVYAGLEYALFRQDCEKIDSKAFSDLSNAHHLSIGICMGGSDSGNMTEAVLQTLTSCPGSMTFMVILGEGYQYSYDRLVEISSDESSSHEIVLVKSNRSMWHLLKQCAVMVVPGGITVYEAAHVGIPTLNFCADQTRRYLTQELEDKGVSIHCGEYGEECLLEIKRQVIALESDRDSIRVMHERSSKLIDGGAANRILDIIETMKS